MSEVYQRAFLVIAAASASDATGGCFSTIAQEYDAKVLRKTCPEVGSLPIYARKLLPHPVPRRTFATEVRGVRWERSKFPLLERAWTYQELFLPRRVVYFTAEELVWECEEVRKCECGGFDAYGTKHESDSTMWASIVAQYSSCTLTFEKDILPAISGLAKWTPQWKAGERYLAGLWEGSLIKDLGWLVKRTSLPAHRARPWRAPSWSWASSTGSVGFWEGDGYANIAEVHSASCTVGGCDPTGEVRSGYLLVSGPIAKVTLNAGGAFGYRLGRFQDKSFFPDYNFFQDSVGKIKDGTALYCLKLYTTQRHYICLVLQPLRDDTYVRVGLLVCHLYFAHAFIGESLWSSSGLGIDNIITIV
jgi:hypothetical protein